MLGPISRRELIIRLKKFGYADPSSGGRHPFMIKGEHKLKVPNKHHKGDIGIGLQMRIIGQAGISKEDWENAL